MKQNYPSTFNINQQNNFQTPPQYMLNLNANPFMASKPPKKTTNQLNNNSLPFHSQSSRIKEVYADNFIQEIKNISNHLTQYPYVGMDTEFPGVIYQCPVATEDFYYTYTKVNVDKLKLIQLGITLTNDKGESPYNYSTWQFNLNFDIDKDKHSNESISMLYNSGIDFNLMKNKGIPHSLFAEYLLVSGLVLNEKITWICFNGSSDFAYLLKYLINGPLPDDEESFIELVNLYFPNLYDIKYLVNDNEAYKGGLNRLAKELEVERNGEIHQAGSDSQVTSDVFFRLIRTNAISNNDLNNGKNVIYGIGAGADAMETINYTQFEPGLDISYLLQNINNMNLGINFKNNNQ
jgi:CCR4-NOT transcription complex subunit 7/8